MFQYYVQYRNRDGGLRWTDCVLLSDKADPLQYVPQFVKDNAVKVERLGNSPYNPCNQYNPYQYNPAIGRYC